MPKPKDFQELKQYLMERGNEDIADAILPLEELATPELLDRYPELKNLALVALSELTDDELEEIAAELEEDEEPTEIPRIMGMPNLTEKASMCDLITFDDLLNWLEQCGVKFES